MREPSELERAFSTRWHQLASEYPEPLTEYTFIPKRKYAFDFAWPEQRIAVEMEGIGGRKSRHTSYIGYSEDCRKYNLAVSNGWRVLRFTGEMLSNDPDGCISLITAMLDREVV